MNTNRKIKLVINGLSIVIVFAVIIWAFVAFFKLGKSGYTNDAQVEEHINPINTRISGYVEKIYYKEHQRVHRGDTLIVLDDSEYRIQLRQAESDLLGVQATREVLQAGLATARNNIVVSNAGQKEWGARLTNAEDNLRRYTNLLEKDAVTRYQFDQVKTEYEALKAKYETLHTQTRTAALASDEITEKLKVAEADVEKAKVALEKARLYLSYTVITAPYDGVMGRMILQEGQLLQASQSIGSIVKEGEKWIVANYKETRAARLQEGQKVAISVDALNGKELGGIITSISAATGAKYANIPVDNSAGNFVKVEQRIPVRIDFELHSSRDSTLVAGLRAGMNAEIRTVN